MSCVLLKDLVHYINGFLEIDRFQDYCPNGLQVEGKSEIRKLVTGVTASQKLLDLAVDAGADAVLVHHGFFWKNENPTVVGMKRRRLKALLQHDISLLGYHLPLDVHRKVGNNAVLAEKLSLQLESVVDAGGYKDILFCGRLSKAMPAERFAEQLKQQLGRTPLHIEGDQKKIETIAWCTGGAQNLIEDAVRLGVDAYLTGEVSEQTTHVARESNIHFFAAGHHATERYGVQALGAHLMQKFSIQYQHIDVDNPV